MWSPAEHVNDGPTRTAPAVAVSVAASAGRAGRDSPRTNPPGWPRPAVCIRIHGAASARLPPARFGSTSPTERRRSGGNPRRRPNPVAIGGGEILCRLLAALLRGRDRYLSPDHLRTE